MPVLLFSAYFLFFCWLIYSRSYFHLKGIPFWWLLLAFLLKIMAAELSWVLFTYSAWFADSSDAFKYFNDGKFLFQQRHDFPVFWSLMSGIHPENAPNQEVISQLVSWNRAFDGGLWNDNRSLVRLNALFCFISGGNYHIHLLFSSFLSFLGLLGIARFLLKATSPPQGRLIAMLLFFIPSVLFWGSMLSKESLAMLAVGLLAYALSFQFERKNIWRIPGLALIAFTMLMLVKPYLLFLLLPLFLAFSWNECFKVKRVFLTYLFLFVSFIVLAWVAGFFIVDFQPFAWLMVKQQDFFNMMGSMGEVHWLSRFILSDSLPELLVKAPLAFLNTLLSPGFDPLQNIYTLFAFIENTLLLIAIVMIISRITNLRSISNTVLFCLFFAFIDFVIIGWISPSIGAVHRYRIIALLFLLSGLIQMTSPNQRKFVKEVEP